MTTLPQYVFAGLEERTRAYTGHAGQLIDLGIGSPDQPMPEPVARALGQAALGSGVSGYPRFRGDPGFLRAASGYMADRFGHQFDAERDVLALAGSKEGIAQLILSSTGPGDVVLVPDVYYPVYARAALLAGADVEFLPVRAENGFLVDWSGLSPDVIRRAKVLIVNYPNNPTGAVADVAFYERAVKFARENDIILVNDAAYAELGFDGFKVPSVFDVGGARDVAVEFYSTSKAFNMAGLRLGFVVGNRSVVDAIGEYRTTIGYGVPTVIQLAGTVALDRYREFVPTTVATYEARRDAAVRAFHAAGWKVDPPAGAMYIWFRVPGGTDDWEWTAEVLDRAGVALTPGSAFGPGGKGFARLSLVRSEGTLVEAIERVLTK